jgi:surface antigen
MKRNTMTAGSHRTARSKLSRLAWLAALGGTLALSGAPAAQAQLSYIFGTTSGPRLSDEDYKIASAAVVKLLNETPAAVGRFEHWSNPASGNHGKLTIQSLYTMNNMPCRKVSSYVVYNAKSGLAPRTTVLGACQVPSGEWKTTTP